MQKIFIGLLLFTATKLTAQELYVYSEPASNMPTHSLSLKFSSNFVPKDQSAENRFMQRYTPEIMMGVSKKLMWHIGGTFADMYTSKFRWESVYTYLKYRFLSKDEVHKHFRMAAFAEGAYSRNPYHYDEINFTGDKSGLQAGLIATQLWNKLAISGTASITQMLKNTVVHHGPGPVYNTFNYSLSSGYLVLPINYTDYHQTNLNVYVELLGQKAIDSSVHYIDLAPALQLIFNSTSKLNLGFRFQLTGNMERMARQSLLLSYEWTFLNALKKGK